MGSSREVMGAKASRDRISKEDLDFLVSNTHYSADIITDWYKGFKQDCPDGKLDPNAFMKIYSKVLPMGNASEFCDHVFRTFDTDKNCYIDFKEFLLAIDMTSRGTPEDKLNWAYSMYDVDGNGWIDLVEMTRLLQSIYQVMDKGRVCTNMLGGQEVDRAPNAPDSVLKFKLLDSADEKQLCQLISTVATFDDQIPKNENLSNLKAERFLQSAIIGSILIVARLYYSLSASRPQ